MWQMILYVLAIWWFKILAVLIVFAISFLWMLSWLTWTFGEEDIDVNHFRRMK